MSDDAPTEPRESEPGQEQATDTTDESMVEGTQGSVESVATRETAPMSDFSGRQAGIGAVVALVGLVVTFAIPLALTLG